MKNRFTTLDLRASIAELQQRFQGMRVANCYDIDSKTYLFKLVKPEQKCMILVESGIRIHSTEFQWPKNMTPSSFSMKLRKHLRTRRLESIQQLGMDRIIDMQFGSNEAAYHVIVELYDRGNIVLTDFEYTILNILRPRTDQSEDVRFAVHEKYPCASAKQSQGLVLQEKVMSLLVAAKEGDNLKKILNPNLVYGPALIEHCILTAGFPSNTRVGKEFNISEDLSKLMATLETAEKILQDSCQTCKGYIVQKKEKKVLLNETDEPEELLTYVEFHPFLFKQHENSPVVELDSFDKATDEFFSKIGSQKLDTKALQQEKAAVKKLDHIKRDHNKRLQELKDEQGVDRTKARLIEINTDLVDRAILVVRSALANQIDWDEIHIIVKEAQAQGDPVASCIKSLKLETNHVTLLLRNPYVDSDEEPDSDDPDSHIKPMKIDVDLELSAYGNARKYFDKKKKAAVKEQKTVDASTKALKSAERKTYQVLKEAKTVASIHKARKTHWFEKFLWFLSSENYVIIGGRDNQQNEFIVKKYLNRGDLYVHADLHGASSVIVKNPTGEPVPPKTLNEAGTMALCNSAAWDAKVVTSAWWVYHHQVTKTAPSGEYLTTGSFMIRGKKNFLPPSYLIYGFGFLFKVDEDSVFRHKGERKVRTLEEDTESTTPAASEDMDDLIATLSSDDDDEPDKKTAESSTAQLESPSGGDTAQQNTIDASDTGADSSSNLDSTKDLSLEGASVKTQDQNHVSQNSEKTEAEEKEDDDDDDDDDSEDEDESQEGDEEAPEDGEEDSDGDDLAFPDTNIGLQYVHGEKLRLQVTKTSRTFSTGSGGSSELLDDLEDSKDTSGKARGPRISAKQRREMKKKSKQCQGFQDDDSPTQESPAQESPTQESPTQESPAQESPAQESPPEQSRSQAEASAKDKLESEEQKSAPKRRQKNKLKKMEKKYKDQDEEERAMKMDILASAGTKIVKKKKGKKGKEQQKLLRQQKILSQKQDGTKPQQGQGQGHPQGQPKGHPGRQLTVADITAKTPNAEDLAGAVKKEETILENPGQENPGQENPDSDDEKQALMEEENFMLGQDQNELDSLTGIPVSDDILHFCVPVCAPYSAMLNYKFKVKLTPGSTKRGKAAKAVVHTFIHDRLTNTREKDLFKSLKDVDVSRNIPGKVKVSIPNAMRQKKK